MREMVRNANMEPRCLNSMQKQQGREERTRTGTCEGVIGEWQVNCVFRAAKVA